MDTIALDWGNSGIKVGCFRDEALKETAYFRDQHALLAYLSNHATPVAMILGEVGAVPDEAKEALSEVAPLWEAQPGMEKGIQLAYKSPDTLGADRLAAAVGAWCIFIEKPVLVIDIGSCITYDYVSASGVYCGGSISPGLHMRLRAMGTFTAGLPTVSPPAGHEPPLTGATTQEALLSGAFHGTRQEIDGFIETYQKHLPALQVVLTGGDARLFESNLKSAIFAEPHLVLKGLNQMLLMNA